MFSQEGLDRANRIDPVQQISPCAHAGPRCFSVVIASEAIHSFFAQ
jgi:hypothetical protein